MPGGDGTGPAGMGSMTGRAAGYCAGYAVPGYMNPAAGRGSYRNAPPAGYARFGPAYGPAYGPVGYGGLARAGAYGAWPGRGPDRGFGRGFGRGFRGGRRGGRFW